MEETSLLIDTDAALEPLLQAAKDSASSNISTVQALVQKVLSDPNIFCGFDQIKSVLQNSLSSSTDGPSVLKTLDLFSYGKYCDYASPSPSDGDVKYLNLNQAQLSKLRQLTVLSLVQDACSSGKTVISYEYLAAQLGLTQPEMEEGDEELWRKVEQIVTSCVYSSLLHARLCQKTKSVVIVTDQGPPCRSRDVRIEDIPNMTQILRALGGRLAEANEDLESSGNFVQKQLDRNVKYFQSVEMKKLTTVQTSYSNYSGMGGGRPTGGSWIGSDGMGGEMNYDGNRQPSRRQPKRSRGGGGRGSAFTGGQHRY